MPNYPTRTNLASRTAKIRRTVYHNPTKRAEEIVSLLAGQGVTANLQAIHDARFRMEKDGIPAKLVTRKDLVQSVLKRDPDLPTHEIVEMFKEHGVSADSVRIVRHELGQKSPRYRRRAKPYPSLSQEHIRLIEESLPIMKRIIQGRVWIWAGRDYAEEAFLELSTQLPYWITRYKPGAKLEAFLDFKVRLALKDFMFKTICQGSGLKQMEVKNGLKWRREINGGKTYSEVAKEYKVPLQEVREIVMALNEYFDTISIDTIPAGSI